jgi:hypothetical protein
MGFELHALRSRTRATALAASLTVTALLPVLARAESAANQWQWSATAYLWLPSLSGETAFPTGDGGPSIVVSADKILDSLNFAFMGTFEGRKGPWGIATDVIYLDLGASEQATRDFAVGRLDLPASVDADLRLDISGWVWTLGGSYEALHQEAFSMSVLAGARMLDLQQDLRWNLNGDIATLPLPGRSGSSHVKDTLWDAIIGVRGRATFGTDRNWFVPYYVDVGTGDSDLTWQGLVGLGYSFDTVDVSTTWRHLDYDLGGHSPVQSITFSGPMFGVTLRF